MTPQNSKSLEHWANAKPGFMSGIHVFLYNKFLYQNELQNSWDLKKMLRKSPASNAWTANFQKCNKYLYQNELQNSWDLKKMLRKSPASNAWTANI